MTSKNRKTPATLVALRADRISAAADAILALGEAGRLTKNGILNAMACAVSGPGHDWGHVVRAPMGVLVQPGVSLPSANDTDGAAPAASDGGSSLAHATIQSDAGETLSVQDIVYDALSLVADGDMTLQELRDDGMLTHNELEDHLMDAARAIVSEDADGRLRRILLEVGRRGLMEAVIDRHHGRLLEEVDPKGRRAAGEAFLDRDIPKGALVVFEEPRAVSRAAAPVIVRGVDELRTFCRIEMVEAEFLEIRPVEKARVKLRFHPQAWIDDEAVDVDEETVGADAPAGLEFEMPATALQDDASDTDHLQSAEGAPDWVRRWSGPYTIEVVGIESED